MRDFDAYQSMVERAEHKPTAPRRAPWRRPRRCWPYIWAAAWIVIAACCAAAVAGVWLSKLIV
jgi:ferric-dicitrate binding protein FerR (iron transport regulator)